ncbi:MAG: DMT family transporter [Sporolactobacillus sp.]|jgi:drug/metabolite transporter (DMT)-like permease|nr:DMT family transporter [Sporolactobacillus sp.]
MKNLRSVVAADTALLAVTFIWGTTFTVIQDTLDRLTPMALNAWRFLLAAAMLGLWQLIDRRHNRLAGGNALHLLLAGGVLGTILFAGYGCQTVGLLYTPASNAAFITGLNVVMVPIFSALLLKKVPSRSVSLGALTAAIGLFFLTTGGRLSFNPGDAVVLGCAVAFALHIVVTEKFTEQFASLPLTIVQLAVVALLSFVVGGLFDGTRVVPVHTLLRADVAAVISFMSLFATALAYLLQTVLQKKIPATHVGVIYVMEPVFAAWTSVLVQHARLSRMELIGCLLILIGMLLAVRPSSAGTHTTTGNSVHRSPK